MGKPKTREITQQQLNEGYVWNVNGVIMKMPYRVLSRMGGRIIVLEPPYEDLLPSLHDKDAHI